jgi:hypothetical protein
MKYKNIREEELKNKVSTDWFKDFDTTQIIGNIDFCVSLSPPPPEGGISPTPPLPKREGVKTPPSGGGGLSLLWAEVKTGDFDIATMFVQLVLTIGKARTFDKMLPPAFLGAFDFKKIAFVPYASIQDFFYLNDFNWNVTPSNHETKEFKLIKDRIEATLKENSYVYDFLQDEKELKIFIKENIAKATELNKIKIDKNNFVPIYLRWLETIKPLIDVNWDDLKQFSITDSDFYLADLFVDDKDTNTIEDDITIKENLFVFFIKEAYRIPRKYTKQIFDANININNHEVYQNFWKRYKRPPLQEFQDYIIERRDLLVPQDIRERKGAFFTPRQWVELSQKYLADVLGEDWQDEYYIWDCAAGTGNLLAGLTNKLNIWASTLDQADVNVMHDRIDNGANLLKTHVFQFDFLNDNFTKLPQELQNIINDEEKRKKLVIYINPPYAEATSSKSVTGTGANKGGVTTNFKINDYFKPKIGNASNEIFALFMANIYEKIPSCTIAQFSKMKFIQGTNFEKFKEFFKAKYQKGFIVPADTFDNVKGQFPIGFTIWNTAVKEKIDTIPCDIFDKNFTFKGVKNFYGELPKSINRWIKQYDNGSTTHVAYMENPAPDFQNNKFLNITAGVGSRHVNYFAFTQNNLFFGCVYFTVRQIIEATWLNDRDQFLCPNEAWLSDREFQTDCLAFTLFHGQNRITNSEGINHWIPFTEREIDAEEKFKSNFMSNFIKGKLKVEQPTNELLLNLSGSPILYDATPLKFSAEATAVFDAGRELWAYYQTVLRKLPRWTSPEPDISTLANASLYDIREYFQERNDKGRMNSKSKDEKYTTLITELRNQLNILADKIAPKVYEYGFLKA